MTNNKPNIIFVLADDMGYGDSSCYGAVKINTPNIDLLASEGMRFTDAHSSSAVCTPSRYSIVTGRYCWRTSLKKGVIKGHSLPLIEEQRLTVASMLRQCGYKTAAFGKWHLGLEWSVKDAAIEDEDPYKYDYSKPFKGGPYERGFDYFFGVAGSLDMSPYCFLENNHTVGIPDREKDHYLLQGQIRGFMTEDWQDDLVDSRIISKAEDFISSHVNENSTQPFFLYVPLLAPHRPCDPPEFIKGASNAGKRGDMVAEVDWCVGRLIDTLTRLDIFDNTLFIFASDNGAKECDVDGIMYGHRSCGDFRGYKGDIWDGGHRIPLVARWPIIIASGSVSNELVSLTDFMATCSDIVDYKIPDNAAEDSFSFLPVLKGDCIDKTRTSLVYHSAKGMFSLRKGPWKYIKGLGSGGFTCPISHDPLCQGEIGQLYNVEDDPWEVSNLYLKCNDVVKDMENELSNIINNERSR